MPDFIIDIHPATPREVEEPYFPFTPFVEIWFPGDSLPARICHTDREIHEYFDRFGPKVKHWRCEAVEKLGQARKVHDEAIRASYAA